jgi:PAS domain S-box-containing protein
VSIAAQLRLAIGLLLVALAAILAAAFYVPQQLHERSNETYVDQVLPLRSRVEELVLRMARQEAAVARYVATRDREHLRRFTSDFLAVNKTLTQLRPYARRYPRMNELVVDVTGDISLLEGVFYRQVVEAERQTTLRERRAQSAQVEVFFADFFRTAAKMEQETQRIADDAAAEQRTLYYRLLVVLGSLGTVALTLAIALFVVTPNRFGQMYTAERRSRREAESRADAARALTHVRDGVILTDADGRVRFWNPAAEKLTGIDEHGAAGRELAKLLPGWERLRRQPDAEGGVGGAAVFPIQLGHERWLSVTSVDFGEGVVYAVRDVTEERGLERMRSEFVSTASHELRTPMTSISGAARTLLRREADLSPDQHRSFLEMIVEESDRLARIVDQILLASRLEAGGLEFVHEACDARAIVDSVIASAKHRAPATIEFEVDGPAELTPIACDSDRLRQVLSNLLDNAVKYSPGGGTVRVELTEKDDTLQFDVHDEGIGFDQGRAEVIFERFRRLDPHLTHGIGGTGLGLYICRELVQRMGGTIWASSEPGRGSTFSFELPLVRERRPSHQHFGTAG